MTFVDVAKSIAKYLKPKSVTQDTAISKRKHFEDPDMLLLMFYLEFYILF